MSRGIYNEIYEDLYSIFSKSDDELIEKIKEDKFSQLKIPNKYKNDSLNKSNELLSDLVKKLSNSKG